MLVPQLTVLCVHGVIWRLYLFAEVWLTFDDRLRPFWILLVPITQSLQWNTASKTFLFILFLVILSFYFLLIILRQLWLLYQVRADLLLITLLISGSQAHRARLRTGYCCFERPEVFLFGHMHLIRILLDSWVYLGESRSRSWVQTSLLLFGTLDLCQDSPIQKFRSVNNN